VMPTTGLNATNQAGESASFPPPDRRVCDPTMATPLWSADRTGPDEKANLGQPSADVVVVGAGIAGLGGVVSGAP
jgi:hypothetical protein